MAGILLLLTHFSRLTKRIVQEVSKSVKCFFMYIKIVQGKIRTTSTPATNPARALA